MAHSTMAHSLTLTVTCDTCGWQAVRAVEQTCICIGHVVVPSLPPTWSFVPGDCPSGPLAVAVNPRPSRWYCPRCTAKADRV